MCLFSETLKLYRNRLTAYEQSEILDYPDIWYLGLESKKIEGVAQAAQNSGYDDENGSYIKVKIQSFIELNSLVICCCRIGYAYLVIAIHTNKINIIFYSYYR